MVIDELSCLRVERAELHAAGLGREAIIDIYLPNRLLDAGKPSLLLINDGQDLPKMPFDTILNGLLEEGRIRPLICVGVHCGPDRKMEYGTAGVADFAGRGAKAVDHERFLLEQLLPYIKKMFGSKGFDQTGIAGFSLGGLSAIDTAWRHPDLFSITGIFSGSLWWRSRDLADGYDEGRDRIMHTLIRAGQHHPGQRFYLTTGSLDETADRNGNGIIDSIDDTLGLIDELKAKGYTDDEIRYVNYEDGRHDVETWGRALPGFLEWAFSPLR